MAITQVQSDAITALSNLHTKLSDENGSKHVRLFNDGKTYGVGEYSRWDLIVVSIIEFLNDIGFNFEVKAIDRDNLHDKLVKDLGTLELKTEDGFDTKTLAKVKVALDHLTKIADRDNLRTNANNPIFAAVRDLFTEAVKNLPNFNEHAFNIEVEALSLEDRDISIVDLTPETDAVVNTTNQVMREVIIGGPASQAFEKLRAEEDEIPYIKDDISFTENELLQTEDTLKALEFQIFEKKQVVSGIEGELAEAKGNLDSLESDALRIGSDLSKLEEKKDALDSQLNEIKVLESAVSKKGAKDVLVKMDLSEKKLERADLVKAIEIADRDLKQKESARDLLISNRQDSVELYNNPESLLELEAGVNIHSDIESFDKDVRSAKAVIDELAQELTLLDTQIENLNAQISKSKVSTKALGETLIARSGEKLDLEAKLEQVTEEIDALNVQQTQKQSELDTAKALIKEIKSDLTHALTFLEFREKDQLKLKQQIAVLTSSIANLEEKLVIQKNTVLADQDRLKEIVSESLLRNNLNETFLGMSILALRTLLIRLPKEQVSKIVGKLTTVREEYPSADERTAFKTRIEKKRKAREEELELEEMQPAITEFQNAEFNLQLATLDYLHDNEMKFLPHYLAGIEADKVLAFACTLKDVKRAEFLLDNNNGALDLKLEPTLKNFFLNNREKYNEVSAANIEEAVIGDFAAEKASKAITDGLFSAVRELQDIERAKSPILTMEDAINISRVERKVALTEELEEYCTDLQSIQGKLEDAKISLDQKKELYDFAPKKLLNRFARTEKLAYEAQQEVVNALELQLTGIQMLISENKSEHRKSPESLDNSSLDTVSIASSTGLIGLSAIEEVAPTTEEDASLAVDEVEVVRKPKKKKKASKVKGELNVKSRRSSKKSKRKVSVIKEADAASELEAANARLREQFPGEKV